MLKPCQTIVFDDSTNGIFSKLLDIFHQVCVDELLCFGKIIKDEALDDVSMTYINDAINNSELLFQKFTKTPADLLIVSPSAELLLIHVSLESKFKKYYCLQVVKEFYDTGEDCCQIWEVNELVNRGHLTKLWYDAAVDV